MSEKPVAAALRADSRRYPDAKSLFQTGLKSVADLKDSCLLVLDTNVLLVPYGTGAHVLADIHKTFKALIAAGRLHVPGQVAREFAEWRPRKLADIVDAIEKKSSQEPPLLAKYPLLSELPEAKAVHEVQKAYKVVVQQHRDALRALVSTLRQWQFADPVSRIYAELFQGDVIVDPAYNPEVVAEELAARYSHGIPPGYKDGGKDDGGPGDYIIWKTILELGRTKKRDLVFVTLEEKADWWHRASSRPFGPRFELMDEYRRVSDGRAFQMTNLSSLLELFGAAPEVIEEVRAEEPVVAVQLAEVPANESVWLEPHQVHLAVHEWLSKGYPAGAVTDTGVFPDFLCRSDSTGRLLGAEWMIVTDHPRVRSKYVQIKERLTEWAASSELYDGIILLALPPHVSFDEARRRMSVVEPLPPNISRYWLLFDGAGRIRHETTG